MERTFSFVIGGEVPETLVPQTARALERRTEWIARAKYPGMWKGIDAMGAKHPKKPTVQKRRHKRWGVLLIGLGLFALIPGLMEPKALMGPLLAGALAVTVGAVQLWTGRKSKQDSFAPAAEKLCGDRSQLPAGMLTLCFSSTGLCVREGEEEQRAIPWQDFQLVVEEEDLFLLFYREEVILLPKAECPEGEEEDFFRFLQEEAEHHGFALLEKET